MPLDDQLRWNRINSVETWPVSAGLNFRFGLISTLDLMQADGKSVAPSVPSAGSERPGFQITPSASCSHSGARLLRSVGTRALTSSLMRTAMDIERNGASLPPQGVEKGQVAPKLIRARHAARGIPLFQRLAVLPSMEPIPSELSGREVCPCGPAGCIFTMPLRDYAD